MTIGKIILFSIFLVTIPNLYALDWQQEFEKKIERLDVGHKNFIVKFESTMDEYKKKIMTREQECLGEFSSFVQDENDRKVIKKVKLTENEKRLCKLTLIQLRTKFLRVAFDLREKYLKQRHKEEIDNLHILKESSMNQLKEQARKLQ